MGKLWINKLQSLLSTHLPWTESLVFSSPENVKYDEINLMRKVQYKSYVYVEEKSINTENRRSMK